MYRDFFRKSVIGFADGLTLAIAAIAGMTPLKISVQDILAISLLITIAGSITMGIGAFVTAKKYEAENDPILIAGTIGASYLLAGIITVLPFAFLSAELSALKLSAGISIALMILCGYLEHTLNGAKGWQGSIRLLLTGSIAASCCYLAAHLFI